MKTCAVIVAAYRAEEFIQECLSSIDKQKSRDGWKYEIRIGVDACRRTSRLLVRLGRDHWWSDRNVGPFLIRNSLIDMKQADAYAIFDADDTMKNRYLETLLKWVEKGYITASSRYEGAAPRPASALRVFPPVRGVCVIPHSSWQKLGGYRGERVASDRDLIVRATKLRLPIYHEFKALRFRRIHPGGLTSRADTGPGSKVRIEASKRNRDKRIAGSYRANLRTVPLKRVGALPTL